MKTLLSAEALQRLIGLIGSKFQFVGGPDLPDYLVSDVVILATDNDVIEVSGAIERGDFVGYNEEFSCIQIDNPYGNNLGEAIALGNQYFGNSGMAITDISVLRERVAEYVSGNKTWNFVSDTAVIFHLGDEAISISKQSFHTEILQVSYPAAFIFKEIPETLYRFEEDAMTKYSRDKKLVSIAELLRSPNAW